MHDAIQPGLKTHDSSMGYKVVKGLRNDISGASGNRMGDSSRIEGIYQTIMAL